MFREKAQSQDFKISSHHQIQLGPLESSANLEPTPIKEEATHGYSFESEIRRKKGSKFFTSIHPSLDHREILIQPFLKTTGKAEGVSLKQGYPMQSL